MPTLMHMAGDPSAAKAAVASALAGLGQLSLDQIPVPPTGSSPAISLALPGGGALTDGNAAARYIGI